MASVNLDTTSRLDITCRKGDTFQLTVTLKDTSGTALPLSTDKYTFLMQVRDRRKNRALPVARTPIVDEVNAALDSQGIVIGSAQMGVKGPVNFQFNSIDDSGNVTIFLSASDMRKVEAGRYRYDFQYKVNDTEKTVLEGSFTVNEDISKSI
jgi:hypothetical protein